MPTSIEMFVLDTNTLKFYYQDPATKQPNRIASPSESESTQATTEVAQADVGGSTDDPGNGMGFWVMIAILFGFMYLFVIRPEKKRQKERVQFQSDLSKGDDVVTAGGLHGVIASLDEHTITLKVSDNVRMKFDRVAVSRRASTQAPEQGK
jgi:preprotein translocase subunit YajC|tara:strand:- start:125 stop:577 length:453 start_codon:yes stop_codon:yes gene_type:complete